MMLLEVLALTIAIVHFATPLIYYAYLKRYERRPWNIRVDNGYKCRLAVILPTYNETEIIKEKLENIEQQDYPKELLKVIVIDSSDDGTAHVVEEWSSTNNDLNLKLIKEKERRGKLYALDLALKHVSPDCGVIVFTDADAFWNPKALSKAVSLLADPNVGAVTARIMYTGIKDKLLENTYRDYYNVVRVAESKVHSTPVHNGPFLAIKAELFHQMGLPMFEGSDDSAFASFIAFTGYRAIEVDDIIVKEPLRGSQILKKIRRAQHLLLNFLATKRYTKKRGLYIKSSFDRIWKIEWWLHVVNPWLLVVGTAFLFVDLALFKSKTGLALLAIGLALLALKSFRMWVFQQLYLAIGAVRNLWNKNTMWKR